MKEFFIQSLKTLVQSSSKRFLLLILYAIHFSALISDEVSNWLIYLLDLHHLTNHMKSVSTICFNLWLLAMLINVIWQTKNYIVKGENHFGSSEFDMFLENEKKRISFEVKIINIFLIAFFVDIISNPKSNLLDIFINHLESTESLVLLLFVIGIYILHAANEYRKDPCKDF